MRTWPRVLAIAMAGNDGHRRRHRCLPIYSETSVIDGGGGGGDVGQVGVEECETMQMDRVTW